jgi:hypothetical protein
MVRPPASGKGPDDPVPCPVDRPPPDPPAAAAKSCRPPPRLLLPGRRHVPCGRWHR